MKGRRLARFINEACNTRALGSYMPFHSFFLFFFNTNLHKNAAAFLRLSCFIALSRNFQRFSDNTRTHTRLLSTTYLMLLPRLLSKVTHTHTQKNFQAICLKIGKPNNDNKKKKKNAKRH